MAAAAAAHQDVRLQVIAEVERTYAELRGAQVEAAILAAEAVAQCRLAYLMRQCRIAGEVAVSDEAQIRAAARALAVLTGEPLEVMLEQLLVPGPLPQPSAQVSAGLRAYLLRRRGGGA